MEIERTRDHVCIIGFAPPFIAVNMRGVDRPEHALAGRVATTGRGGRPFPKQVTSDSIAVFTAAIGQYSLVDGWLTRAEGPGARLSNGERVPAAMEPESWPLTAFGPIDPARRPAVADFWSDLVDRRTCQIAGCEQWLRPGVDLCEPHLTQRLTELDRADEELLANWNAESEELLEHFRAVRRDMDVQGIEPVKTSRTWRSGPFSSVPCHACGGTTYAFEAQDPGWVSIRSWVSCARCRARYPRWDSPPDPLERPRSTPIELVEFTPTPDTIRADERKARRRERAAERRAAARSRELNAADLQTLLRVCADRGDHGWIDPESLDDCCPSCGSPLKGPRHQPGGPTCAVRIYERRISCGDWIGPTILGMTIHLDWFAEAHRVWPRSHQAAVASHVKRASKYGTTLGHDSILASAIPGQTAARTIVAALAESMDTGQPLAEVLGVALAGQLLPEPIWPERR